MQTRQRMRIYKIPKQAKGIKGRTRAMWRQFPTAPDVYNPLEPKWQHACIAFGPRGVWRVSRYPYYGVPPSPSYLTNTKRQEGQCPPTDPYRHRIRPPMQSGRIAPIFGAPYTTRPTLLPCRNSCARNSKYATHPLCPHTVPLMGTPHGYPPVYIYIYAQAHQPKYRTCVQAGTHMYVGSHCNFHLHR